MALLPIQERYLRRFFPGLVESIPSLLGAGEFRPERPELRQMGPGLRGVGLHVAYGLKDGSLIAIKISSRLRDGEPAYVVKDDKDLTPVDLSKWDRIHYALHYGKTDAYEKVGVEPECFFRFDLQDGVHHVHIQPNTKLHVVASNIVENVTNMDPRKFVELVAKYRRDGVYPVRKKS